MAVVLRGDPTDEGMAPTPYEAWVRRQGVPIVEGYGVTDLARPGLENVTGKFERSTQAWNVHEWDLRS